MTKKPNMNNSDFKELMEAAGLYSRNAIEWYDKFSRFGCIDPYNSLGNTREYIFITKPDLHLFENGVPGLLNPQISGMTFFRDMNERYREVLCQLQISNKDNRSPFMNILSNAVVSDLDLPTITAGEVEGPSNIYGDDIPYRWSSGTSDNNHEFSLEFEDTKYLEVYMLFKTWDEYVRKKSRGGVTPPTDAYIFNKILHDQVSAYKIIVGADGETIIFFAKLWGVYPKGVPREAFSSMNKDGGLRYTVQFNATFVEDSDPIILQEFNTVVNYKGGVQILPLYNSHLGHVDGTWATMPFIEYDPKHTLNPIPSYKLKWRV